MVPLTRMLSALKEIIDRKWTEKASGRHRTVSGHSGSSGHWKKKSQSENRWVFRRLRNVAEESASLIVCGRAFHSLGGELEKALKPSCFLVCLSVAPGICRRDSDEERKDRAGIYRGMSSCEYSGAVPSWNLYAKDMILWSIHFFTGNQCSCFETGVMCSVFRVRVTILAAVFKSGQHRRNSYCILCPCRQEGAELAKVEQVVKTTSYSVADVILHGDPCINNQA